MLNKKIIILVAIGIASSSVSYFIFDLQMQGVRPFEGTVQDHIDELKKIPEVITFYEKYTDYKITVGEFSDTKYQPVFTIETGDKLLNMHIQFFNGKPTYFYYICSDLSENPRIQWESKLLDYDECL